MNGNSNKKFFALILLFTSRALCDQTVQFVGGVSDQPYKTVDSFSVSCRDLSNDPAKYLCDKELSKAKESRRKIDFALSSAKRDAVVNPATQKALQALYQRENQNKPNAPIEKFLNCQSFNEKYFQNECQKTINAFVAKRLFTQDRKKTVTEYFAKARAAIQKDLSHRYDEAIKSKNQTAAKRWLDFMQKIATTALVFGDCEDESEAIDLNARSLGMREIRKSVQEKLQSNELTVDSAVCIHGAALLADELKDGLYFTLIHELYHRIGPEERKVTYAEEKTDLFAPEFTCLRDSVGAQKADPGCYERFAKRVEQEDAKLAQDLRKLAEDLRQGLKSPQTFFDGDGNFLCPYDQLSESFSDDGAAKRYSEESPLPTNDTQACDGPDSKIDLMKIPSFQKLANVVSVFCDPSKRNDSHLEGKDRINRIIFSKEKYRLALLGVKWSGVARCDDCYPKKSSPPENSLERHGLFDLPEGAHSVPAISPTEDPLKAHGLSGHETIQSDDVPVHHP